MDAQAFVRALFDQMATAVIALLFALSIVNWVLGSLRAFASHQWDVTLWDVFIRKDIAGRVLPLTIVILLGRSISVAIPGLAEIPLLRDLNFITGAGYIAAVPYIFAKAKSIQEAVMPSEPDRPPLPE